MKNYRLIDHLKFIIPSLIGIFLFIIPVKMESGFTIPIAILSNWVQALLADQLSAIMMAIIVITAIMTVIIKITGRGAFQKTPFFQKLFDVNTFWTITQSYCSDFRSNGLFSSWS